MEQSHTEIVKSSALLGGVSVAALTIDPSGMSSFLIGILGNAAYDQVKKLKGGLRSLFPTEIFIPDHPLNQALARSITKALHFAAGSDALRTFSDTPSWQNLTISERNLVRETCDELRRVASGEIHSCILATGVGVEIEKALLDNQGPAAFERLKERIRQQALFGFPDAFVDFLFRQIETHIGAFFWAEVVGSDPEHGPWREYANLIFRSIENKLASLGDETAELRKLIQTHESEMKPFEVVAQINATLAAHVATLSSREQSHFEALRTMSLDISASVRASTEATLHRVNDAERHLGMKLDDISRDIQDFKAFSAPQRTSIEELTALFRSESSEVIGWVRALVTGESIPRTEIESLRTTINSKKHSTTLLLGPPGAGKSALLSELAVSLTEAGTPVLGFRADTLPRGILKFEDIVPTLPDPDNFCEVVRRIGATKGIVLLIDQLDSVSSIVDKHPERLNLVLRLIRELDRAPGVHIIAACRIFEREHDPRLTLLNYESLELTLPRWQAIDGILQNHGFAIPEQSSELRELLRTPLHLSDFLKDAVPGDAFFSVQGLLEKVWEKRVTTGKEAELLEIVARRMLADEELWIPKSAADGHQAAFNALVGKKLLQARDCGRLIGFHHQTYFDFALARAFSNVEGFSISQHILGDGHDGLFVRPLLISVLTYLRGTAGNKYHQEIVDLLAGARLHIRQLVIGLIGTQQKPTSHELASLLARLDNSEDRPRALRALGNSIAGVRALLDNADFVPRGMADDLSSGNELSGFLSSAATHFPDEVSDLIEEQWLPNNSMDRLSCWVLRNLTAAGPRQLRVLGVIAGRVDQSDLWFVLDSLANHHPEVVPELLASCMRAPIDKAKLETAALLKGRQDLEAKKQDEESDDMFASFFDFKSHLKPLERILESNPCTRLSLNKLIDKAPIAVIEHLWPIYTELLVQITDSPKPESTDNSRYREDSIRDISDKYHGPDVFCNAMKRAVVALSETAPEKFLELSRSAAASDLMSVHSAIAGGLARLTHTHPREVFSYLMGDARRLFLGGRFDHEVSTTAKLVRCASGLNPEERLELERRIILFYEGELPVMLTPVSESEDYFRKWCGSLMARILQAFPEGTLSADGQMRLIGLSRTVDAEGGLFESRGGTVGPRNTAEELAERSEDELFQIAEELPDSTGWNNPELEDRWKDGPERAGGAIQQARVFETLASKDPTKFIGLLEKFIPGKHELYAARVIEGLGNVVHSGNELTDAILLLVARGFESREFRETVARTAEGIADQHRCLDPRMIDVLLRWLDSEEHPKQDAKEESDYGEMGSMVFGQATWVSHGGREALISALARAFAISKETPDSAWLDLIESRLALEKNTDVWAITLARMPWFFRDDPKRASTLVHEVLLRHPPVVLHPAGSRAIAGILQVADPISRAEEWLVAFEGASIGAFQMLAGELYPLLALRSPTARARLEEFVRQGQSISFPLLRGLIRATKGLWGAHSDLRPVGLELLRIGLGCEDESIRTSASTLLSRMEVVEWDSSLCSYVDDLCQSKEAILADAYGLARVLAREVDHTPEQALKVSRALLHFGGDRFGDHSTSLPMVPESILQISVNLHRLPEFRDAGLDLFEQLLRSGFLGASQALEDLQRH